MRLATERLLLRPPALGDAEALATITTDPQTTEFLRPRDRDETRAWIERQRDRHVADGFGQLVVVRKDDGRLIGRSGLLVWNRSTWKPTTLREAGDDAEIEVGWVLAPDVWSNGYATEAGVASRDYALRELRRDRVIALIAHGNVRSVAVAERLGMRYAGDVPVFEKDVELWEYVRD